MNASFLGIRTGGGISSRTWSMRTRSFWRTENRDSRKMKSLVCDLDSAYRKICSNDCRLGNMFMFYFAGHEVRVVSKTWAAA